MTVPQSVSLVDVARQAGVSSQTVSRVVRGDSEVSDATRARIKKLIKELGYRPNLAARSLASSRTGVIHVLLAAPMFHGHAQTFLALIEAAMSAGYYVSVSSGRDALSTTPDKFGHLTPLSADGVIILGGEEPVVPLLESLGEYLPLVLALSGEESPGSFSTVSFDDLAGARLATEHLIEQGVQDIVHIVGPQGWVAAAKRQEGFDAVCAEHGLTPRTIQAAGWGTENGYDAMRSLSEPPPQGVVAANDALALGALRELHEQGVKVPKHTAVVGFDNIDGSESFFPPLSTVQMDYPALGRAAVTALAALLDGAEPEQTLLEPTLIVRDSSRRSKRSRQ
jgi:DNA-binding LacI/PurR family transcriptional regulator